MWRKVKGTWDCNPGYKEGAQTIEHMRNDQLLPAGGAPLSPSGSRWSAILYRPPYGFTGWGERQTGHEVVLRTLTCLLPTNLPPPLHSELIYVRLQPTKSESLVVELMLAILDG